MGKKTSIILGKHFDLFIKQELATGRYASANEVIRSGLRKLEEEREKYRIIAEALVVGEKSGKPIKFENEEFKTSMRLKYAKT